MRLTWWQCGCLYAQGVHDPRPAAPPWCEAHRTPIERTDEQRAGVIVLDLLTMRYEWQARLSTCWTNVQVTACITPDDRLWEKDLGTVVGGTFRPSGGRRRLEILS